LIGKYEGDEWIGLARKEIQGRLEKFGQEIRFNLMAVCEDLKLKALREIETLKVERAGIAKALRNLEQPYDAAIIEQYPEAESSTESDASRLVARNEEINMLVEEKEGYCHSEDLRREERKVRVLLCRNKTLEGSITISR
jgi:hypothetical protein